MKNPLIKIGLVVFLVLALTTSAFAAIIFDLTGYNSTIVNDAMASYTTPAQICGYMAANFDHTPRADAYSPYQQWLYEDGDCNDYSTFAIYCAYKNGHPKDRLYQVYIKYTNGDAHMLAIYTWAGGYYHYSSKANYYTGRYSWIDCVRHHDTQVSKTVRYGDLYDYDLNKIMRWYFN